MAHGYTMNSISQNTPKQTTRRTPRTAWPKGQSGNPGGRPKVAQEIRELARQHGPAAIDRLVTLMHSSNEGVAVRAAEALLDRGFGRAPQGLEMTGKDGGPITVTQPAPDLSGLTDQEMETLEQLTKKIHQPA